MKNVSFNENIILELAVKRCEIYIYKFGHKLNINALDYNDIVDASHNKDSHVQKTRGDLNGNFICLSFSTKKSETIM